jgi:hypothetical protein
MVMKQSQWAIAAIVLAALVFVVTFAMNYLGGQRQSATPLEKLGGGELRFFWRNAPLREHAVIEAEEKSAGSYDFWFRNDNLVPVQVGLERMSCKCSAVELFLLPDQAPRLLAAQAIALLGSGWQGHLALFAWYGMAGQPSQQAAGPSHELMQKSESVMVPGGAAGWVRMHWKGEQPGAKALEATLTFDGKESGRTAILRTRVFCHEPLRVYSVVSFGVLRDKDLTEGVTRHIVCWSSTRKELRLEVASSGRRNPASDPMVVGKPERISPTEALRMEMANNTSKEVNTFGQVLCAYKIPVTVNAVSRDGTPFDIGPISRHVAISSPDISGEPKQVVIHGRVRGAVEIGNDDDGSQINFSTFARSRGKSDTISLQSDVPDLTLQFDEKRTPPFLTAKLNPLEKRDGRQRWQLTASVQPGKASGVFPRLENPLYEDSAVYLKAYEPGKPTRWVRIAVQGTASER